MGSPVNQVAVTSGPWQPKDACVHVFDLGDQEELELGFNMHKKVDGVVHNL